MRLIFQKYVYEGYGVKRICNYLVENHIMGRNGKNIPTTTLVRMVRNKCYTGYLINGNVEKECPELRIIEQEVFDRAQELRDTRRREKGEDSDSYSPHALLCGKVFCAHCGNRLNITSSGRTRLRADGSTVKEKRFRYSCHYNVRHPGQCDGQSGYGVTKLDAIVESIVCTKFSEILECSKSKLLQDMLRKDMEVAQKEVSRAKSELDLKENACTFYIWHQVYRLTRVRIHDKLYIVSCGLKGGPTMSVKYTTPAQHKSNLRNVYGTFAIEGMTISKDTRSNLDRIGSGQASYQRS